MYVWTDKLRGEALLQYEIDDYPNSSESRPVPPLYPNVDPKSPCHDLGSLMTTLPDRGISSEATTRAEELTLPNEFQHDLGQGMRICSIVTFHAPSSEDTMRSRGG